MRALLLAVGITGLVAGVCFYLFGSGDGPTGVVGLMPEGADEAGARAGSSAQEAVLAATLEVGVAPAGLRVVSAAPAEPEPEVEADVIPPTVGVAIEVKMDRRARRLGVPLKFGVGSSRPGPLGEARVDSDSILTGVLESGDTFQGTVEVDERATRLWVRTEEPGKAQIKWFRTIGDGTVQLTLQAKDGGTARGRVVTASGLPPTKGRVRLYPEDGDQLGGRLQGDGRFEAHIAGDGDGKLSVDGLEQGATEVELSDLDDSDPPQDLIAELAPGLPLGGVIVDGNGRPVPGTKVLVVNDKRLKGYEGRRARSTSRYLGVEPDGREGDQHVTGGDGSFVAVGLEPGDYHVLALADGARNWERLGTEPVPAGRTDYTFTIEARRLRVRVALPEGGYTAFDPLERYRPVMQDGVLRPLQERLRVVVDPLGESREGSSHSVRWHDTGDPTVWEVSLEAHRRYLLQATSLHRPPANLTLDLLQDELVREVVLELAPTEKAGKLRLTVIDPLGSDGVTGYSLTFGVEGGPRLPPMSYVEREPSSDSAPHDVFLELPAGRYEVTARPQQRSSPRSMRVLPEGASGWVDIVSGGSHVLTLESIARGAVSLQFSAPHDFPTVAFFDSVTGELAMTYETKNARSWRTKSVMLPPGAYRIEADKVAQEFELKNGQYLKAEWIDNPAKGEDGQPPTAWKISGQ